jgi:hypothetical protein
MVKIANEIHRQSPGIFSPEKGRKVEQSETKRGCETHAVQDHTLPVKS